MSKFEKLADLNLIFEMDGVQAIALCGVLQVALRHPGIKGTATAALARELIDFCISVFEHEEELREWADMIRMGDDPAFDGPAN